MMEERVCRYCFVSSGLGSIESRMMRHEGCDDRRPVTNFLLLEMLEPWVDNRS